MGDDQADATMKNKRSEWSTIVTIGGNWSKPREHTGFIQLSFLFTRSNKSIRLYRRAIKTDLGSSGPSSETSPSVPTR